MKTILTLLFVIFFGAISFAQNVKTETKVVTIEMGVVLSTDTLIHNTIETTKDNTIVRVYKLKNDRVKKALVFETKKAFKIA